MSIYHAGDTGVFLDMQLIDELYKPDYLLLPIGGNFTMNKCMLHPVVAHCVAPEISPQ